MKNPNFRIKISFILVVQFFIVFSATGISTSKKVKYYTEQDGLNDRKVTGFVFDQRGVGWASTQSGLLVFDGKKFIPAKTYLKSYNSEVDGRIDGLLYLKEKDALILFVYKNGTTSIMLLELQSLFNATILRATKQPLRNIYSAPGETSIWPVIKNSRLAVVIGKRLYFLDFVGTSLKSAKRSSFGAQFVYYDDKQGWLIRALEDNKACYSVTEDTRTGKLIREHIVNLSAYQTNQLFKFKGIVESNQIQFINPPILQLRKRAAANIDLGLAAEFDNAVGCVMDYLGNEYLFGELGCQKMYEEDIFGYSKKIPSEPRVIMYNSKKDKLYVATATGIYPVTMDSSHNVGLPVSNTNKQYYYSGAYVDSNSFVFFPLYPTTSLAVYNLSSDSFSFYNTGIDQEILSSISGFGSDRILVGTRRGLFFAKWRKQKIEFSKANFFLDVPVYSILKKNNDEAYVATEKGIYLINVHQRKSTKIRDGEFWCLEKFGNGWAAGGLMHGLLIFDKNDKLRDSVITNNATSTNTIYTICYKSSLGFFFLGTANGLAIYNPQTKLMKEYYKGNFNTRVEFNKNSSLFVGDTLIMGSLKELFFVNSQFLSFNTSVSLTPSIWSYEANYGNYKKSYFIAPELKKHAYSISLEYNLKSIDINLSDFSQNEKFIIIGYKLDNQEWQYITNTTQIRLEGLSPGKYNLSVKYFSIDASEAPVINLIIDIQQPIERMLFVLTMILLVMSIIVVSLLYLKEKIKRLKQLKVVSENKQRLFSIIAHDLKTPIKTYQGLSETLLYLLEKQDFDGIRNIGNEIDRLGLDIDILLDNLLKWVDSAGIEMKVERERFTINELLEKIMPLYESIARQKGSTIHWFLGDQLIFSDKQLLGLLVRNLIDNAIKHSPAKHSITCRIYTTNESLLVIEVMNYFEITDTDKLHFLTKLNNSHYVENLRGLGLKFVLTVLKKLKGWSEIEIDDKRQTFCYQITIPIADPEKRSAGEPAL